MKYTSLSKYLKKEYGERFYKLSLSCATTCPNRDGACGNKGCIFCSIKGSGDFSQNALLDVSSQIERAKQLVKNKTNNSKYIAYFQSFTSTYGDIEYLRKVFFETITRDDIAILSIATRPDCLPDNVIELIRELNNIKPVWVELGLQSIHDNTAKYIRRGYDTKVYFDSVRKLKAVGVHVITHVIIGLPYETHDMMLETVKQVSKVTDGIKLQLLHVLKGTDLEKEYNDNKFETLSLDEYADILCKCISVLPENVVIHRLTGDGDKKLLVSPLWTKDKKRVLNYINHRIATYNKK
ncbi:MAG: TIGR01212 family radical SAM protein [Ruminococcaceae bacterium]|nr:TIGR01212 family radical SAM protein [Oscillospiraceae bacterium]